MQYGKLFFLLLMLPIASAAQTFGEANARWFFSNDNFLPPFSYGYYELWSEKDTILAGDTAQVFYQNYNGEITAKNLIFRTQGTQVDVWFAASSKFLPLYDFSATVGDTLISCNDRGDTAISFVDSTGTKIINGRAVRYQALSTSSFSEFVLGSRVYETIGSDWFILPQSRIVDPPTYGGLRCFENDSIGLKNWWGWKCDSINSVDEIDLEDIQIFPNPNNGFVQWESSSSVKHVEIYNNNGHLLKRLLGNSKRINLQDLESGTYHLIFEIEEGKRFRKAIALFR